MSFSCLPERVSPELQYLEVKFAALMSYGLTVNVLEWLDGLGCRNLGELRRLPRAGLQRRCGAGVNEAMDRALGQAPEIFGWLEAPPSFGARVELPDRIEHAEAIRPADQQQSEVLANSGTPDA